MIEYETRRWANIVFSVRGTVIPRILDRTLMFGGVGAVAAYVHGELGVNLAINGTAHAMVGVALGLMLVFRTNASYDRYWEGRRLLGGMVNNCRDLARQSGSFLSQESAEVRDDVRRLIHALHVTVRHSLRGESDWPDVAGYLTDAERSALEGKAGAPLIVAGWLTNRFTAEANAGRLSEHRLGNLDVTLGEVIDTWGGCERILRTPVPFAYAHHIKTFLSVFCVTAPFAMLGPMGWLTPVATAVVSYGLFGIDEIGVEIEDPFGYDHNDLPLNAIGDVIDRDVADVMRSPT